MWYCTGIQVLQVQVPVTQVQVFTLETVPESRPGLYMGNPQSIELLSGCKDGGGGFECLFFFSLQNFARKNNVVVGY